MIASNSASSSANEVSIRQATSGIRDRISRQTLDPVAVGQAHVEHGHVRPQRRDPGQRGGRGARLADHLDVRLGLEQVAHAAPDHLVVVQQEDPDRLVPGSHIAHCRHP